MRLFVSTDLPKEVTSYITLLQKQIFKQELFEGKLIPTQQLHLTLQFIGEVDQQNVTGIQGALRGIVMPVFEVCIGDIGVLPSNEYIRIIWIDLKGKALHELAKKIHEVLDPLVKLEDRSFLSHVTVVRVKKVKNQAKLISYLDSIQVEPICFSVNEFILQQSILSHEGPEYSVIERYRLKVT